VISKCGGVENVEKRLSCRCARGIVQYAIRFFVNFSNNVVTTTDLLSVLVVAKAVCLRVHLSVLVTGPDQSPGGACLARRYN